MTKFLKMTLSGQQQIGQFSCLRGSYVISYKYLHYIDRLLVNLTQPAYLCFGDEYPSVVGRRKDPELMKCFIEVNNHLKLYKEVSIEIAICIRYTCMLLSLYTQAFANQKVMNVLGSTLADHCQKVSMYFAVLLSTTFMSIKKIDMCGWVIC